MQFKADVAVKPRHHLSSCYVDARTGAREGKKMKKYFILSILLSFLLFSCTSIKVSTVKNNDKRISEISGFLVFCDIADIGLRTELENNIVKKLSAKGKVAKESVVLFPPLKNYNSSEIYEESKKNELNTKLIISPITSSSKTGYMYMYGMLLPVSSTNNSFDVLLQDLESGEIIIHSTVNTEGDSLKYIISKFSEKIVSEICNEECKEFITIMQELSNQELNFVTISENKYSIIGTSKIGDIIVNNGNLEIKMPMSFGTVNDERKIAEIINTENSSYYRIRINSKNDLQYIVDLLKEYSKVKK